MSIALYTLWRSSAAYRVRIALGLKGLVYETRATALMAGEHRTASYLERNPEGLVPTLLDGEQALAQSLAIIEYLDETHPSPPLLPGDPLGRARVRALAQNIACDIHPLNNLRVLNYLRDPLRCSDEQVQAWYEHWIAEGLRGLEVNALRYSPQRRFLFGDAVSLADVCLVPQMYNARRFKCDLAPYPALRAICDHLESLPAFAAARPEVQPDAPSR